MESLTLPAGLLLPWLAGALGLMAVEARINSAVRPNRLRQAGYGFFLGYAVLFLAILASDALFDQVHWPCIMVLLTVLAAGAGTVLWLAKPPPGAPGEAHDSLGIAGKILLPILAAWTGLHLLLAAIEVFNLPLYPWDAWLAWVYRAKAWFLAGGMVDIVSPAQWAQSVSGDIYTIDAWTYPLFPSMAPYWAALSLGHWSETLVNLPVLLAGIAIGLGLYGQCRESGMNPLFSVAACYMLFSTPLFATHIALAGYADIWMAGFAGLGFVALMRGTISGQRWQTLLGMLLLAFAMLVKNEGTVWFLAALLMQALITFRWRTSLIAGLVIVAALWTAHLLGMTHVDIPVVGTLGVVDGRLHIPFIGHFALEVHDVWRPYRDNFFLMGSWNLLWVLVTASLLLSLVGRRALSNPARLTGVIFIGIFLATQLFIFGFTDQGIWADTYTAINRLPLHFLPALIYAAMVIFHSRAAWVGGHRVRVAHRGLGSPVGLSRLWPAALLLTALVIAGSVAYLARGLPHHPADVQEFGAADFNFVMGSGSADNDRIVVAGFTDGYALLSSGPLSIPSDDYRFLQLRLEPSVSGAVPILFWRRGDLSDELIRVPVRTSGTVLIDLSTEQGWLGEITELGLLFQDGNEGYVMGPMVLEPDSLTLRIQLAWNGWVAFEGWSQKSINFLQGGAARQLVSLPVLVIAWLLLTLFLIWLWSRLRNSPQPGHLLATSALVFLAAWITLDLRWTANSLAQSKHTIETLWGASEDERLAHMLDAEVFRYVRRLKREVLSDRPFRILIIGEEGVAEYLLQRAKYHLLPHSAHVTRSLVGYESVKSFDYLVLFGDALDLAKVKGWQSKWQSDLQRADSTTHAELFEVRKPARFPPDRGQSIR